MAFMHINMYTSARCLAHLKIMFKFQVDGFAGSRVF